jgi:hypothetical protein
MLATPELALLLQHLRRLPLLLLCLASAAAQWHRQQLLLLQA